MFFTNAINKVVIQWTNRLNICQHSFIYMFRPQKVISMLGVRSFSDDKNRVVRRRHCRFLSGLPQVSPNHVVYGLYVPVSAIFSARRRNIRQNISDGRNFLNAEHLQYVVRLSTVQGMSGIARILFLIVN